MSVPAQSALDRQLGAARVVYGIMDESEVFSLYWACLLSR
jgi:hypothetical protein